VPDVPGFSLPSQRSCLSPKKPQTQTNLPDHRPTSGIVDFSKAGYHSLELDPQGWLTLTISGNQAVKDQLLQYLTAVP